MSIWGSLIGGMIGFSLGGPFGMLLGSLLGGKISRARAGASFSNPAQSQQMFALSLIVLSAKLSKADGQVSKEELIAVKDKLKIHFSIYNSSSSIDNRKDDILYWPSKKDSIDIRDYLLEILLVEVPFKKLCSTDCKGICIKCGLNRNDESCLCEKNK